MTDCEPEDLQRHRLEKARYDAQEADRWDAEEMTEKEIQNDRED